MFSTNVVGRQLADVLLGGDQVPNLSDRSELQVVNS
jgi:hypothetical protein